MERENDDDATDYMKNPPDYIRGRFLCLFGVFDGASLADDVDLDDARVTHSGFNLVGDVAGEFEGGEVVDLFGLDDDADFPTGGDGVGFVDAGEGGGDVF